MLEDELIMLERAIDDLYAVRALCETMVGVPEWSMERETLQVVKRAVGDIASVLAETQASLEGYDAIT